LATRALAHPELVPECIGRNMRGVLVPAGKAGTAWTFAYGDATPAGGRLSAFARPGGQVVDCSGAGDAFLAGFLVELLRKGGLKELAYASPVASCAEFGGRLLQPDR
jgi:sugar/nucleoside kinase (ribokinase family)